MHGFLAWRATEARNQLLDKKASERLVRNGDESSKRSRELVLEDSYLLDPDELAKIQAEVLANSYNIDIDYLV